MNLARLLRLRRDGKGASTRLPAQRIALDAIGGAQQAAARWVQIAYTGEFKGHASGEFEFTPELFAQLIANFHSHPSYNAGATQADAAGIEAGKFDVIPWDFQHASEQPSTSGSIPVAGAPAQGWILELELRTDAASGVTQLWALTRFLEPLRSYVLAGKYKWASVTVYFDARDPKSGAPIGPYMSSVAATNDPFLQGMVPLAAKRGADAKSAALGYYYDPYDTPETAEELLCELRELFELSPTSQIGDVLAELAKLRAWATGGMAPPIGVDVAHLVGCLRRLFNLPTLSDAASVFDEAGKLLSALAESAAASAGAAGAPANQSSATPAATATRKDQDMNELVKLLAARFGIPVDEEAVKKAIIVRLDGGENAMAGLSAILSALGVEDVAGATSKIAQMFKSVDELEKAMPELKSLRDQQMAAEEDEATGDVEQAMASYAMPAAAKAALTALRTGGIDAKDLAGRAKAKAAFLAAYPKVEASRAKLLSNTFGSGSGAQTPKPNAKSLGRAGDDALEVQILTDGPVVDLERYSGNATERALAWLRDNDPSAKTLTREQAFYKARDVLAQARSLGQRV